MKKLIVEWKKALGLQTDQEFCEAIDISFSSLTKWRYVNIKPSKAVIDKIEVLIFTQVLFDSNANDVGVCVDDKFNLIRSSNVGKLILNLKNKNRKYTPDEIMNRITFYQKSKLRPYNLEV